MIVLQHRLRNKFLFYFILIILITLLLLTVPYYLAFRNNVLQSTELYSANLTDQITSSVYFVATRLEEQVKRQIQASRFPDRLVALSEPDADPHERTIAVEDVLYRMLYPPIGIEEMYFFAPWGTAYAKSNYPGFPDESVDVMAGIVRDTQGVIENYWEEFRWFSVQDVDATIYIATAIYLKNIMQPGGILVAGIRREYLESFFKGYDPETGGDIAVFNREHELVYTNRQSSVDDILPFLNFPGVLPDSRTPVSITVEGERQYQITWDAFRDNRIYICHIYNLNIIGRQIAAIRTVLLLTALIATCAASLAAYSLAGIITKRLSLLVESIAYIEEGHFQTQVPDLGSDEIGELGIAFNRMTASLSRTLATIAEDEARIRESEVRALQAEYEALQTQINPHFLYNALESINSLAKIREADDIAHIATVLARLFRYNLNSTRKTTSLADELDQVRDYLAIQEIVLGRFQVVIDVPDDLLAFAVPRFCLQPLVENAVLHGLENRKSDGVVVIAGRITGSELEITVSDNGVGMSQSDLVAVRAGLERQKDSDHIGIASVHRRIQLLYGTEYGVSIRSNLDTGTTLTVRLPGTENGTSGSTGGRDVPGVDSR